MGIGDISALSVLVFLVYMAWIMLREERIHGGRGKGE